MTRLITLVLAVLLLSTGVQADLVKKSKSGICHDTSSRYYERTKKYTAFDNLQECLDRGGRLPKGSKTKPTPVTSSKYQRSYFGSWIDEDKDCLNTRHELLMKLSTGTVNTGSNRCTVSRGRWLDPYTGQIFYEAKQLDIDHLVPLKWAWDHGADKWSKDKRIAFANDEANLFAVKARVNRQKGALGPFEWMPPARSFHCQYVVRFNRIMKAYRLQFTASESEKFRELKSSVCK
ncbi:HNH endonuclease family protein [Pelagibaculum spongiae]|uniref:HNH endonuclease n=1 Tax=Pelagibaculum spongiae TaxID=2080658 RepID=A0A2V1GVZ1_9GAMM|nr:HNH endonuclease family protein [Pelagibaculum spongiae]PVZ64490.1 HNH endonuclease [Pelagibaculum spongiae]